MSKNLIDFSNIVIETIRNNRTRNAQKAGRQVQFIFKAILDASYSEKEFVNFLNILLRRKVLALIGTIYNRTVILHKILPTITELNKLSSNEWKLSQVKGIDKIICRPSLYITEDGFPGSLIRKKVFMATSGKTIYEFRESKIDLLNELIETANNKSQKKIKSC